MIESPPEQSADKKPSVGTVEYGREDSAWNRFRRSVGADVGERAEGFFVTIGLLIASIGLLFNGWQRLGIALGLASLAGGLGLAIAPFYSSGPFWMAMGGFVLGLSIPLPKRN